MNAPDAAARESVLVVDDNPVNLDLLKGLLDSRYEVHSADSGAAALRIAVAEPAPDLILLDVRMPAMTGYELLARLRAEPRTREIPVIFMTVAGTTEDEEHGLALGAVDFIVKPLRPSAVLARVQTHLNIKRARDRLQHENHVIQEVTVRALARLAQARDHETGHHLLRTQAMVQRLAQAARCLPHLARQLDERTLELIVKAAPLHDIGKVGIPDRVLLKPGALDEEERRVMQQHVRLGAEAIDRAIADIGEPVPFLLHARQVVLHHHERWDGGGYPDGLAGEAIPLGARLMAIADVFDALASSRPYKPAMPLAQVRQVMAAERGGRFDPDLLDCFLAGFDEFCAILRRLPDELSGTAAA